MEVSVVPEIEVEDSEMKSGSSGSEMAESDSYISSDEEYHDDRENDVPSSCYERDIEPDYGEWTVGEDSDREGDLDNSFYVVKSASGRVLRPPKHLKDFSVDRN